MANSNSHLFQTLTDDKLRTLIATHTGCELTEYFIKSGGLFNTTYQISLSDGRKMILRVGPVHPELLMYYEKDMMEAETFIFHAMEDAGIPCSHVVATGVADDRDFMLVDYIDSVPLSSVHLNENERKVVMDETVEALSKMHLLKGPAFGRVAEVLNGKGHPTWFDHVLYEVETIMDQARGCGSFTAAEAEHVIACIKHAKDALDEATRPSLCHGDLWGGNILVKQTEDGWHLAAIIDVDRAVYGDLDFDLGSPWLGHHDLYQQPKNTKNRRIRMAVYSMMFFIYEAHVWYLQYNDMKVADRARQIVLKKATQILRNEID